LAAWALLLIETTLRVAGQSLFQSAPKFGSDLYIHGVIALSQGFMLSSMVLSAMLAHVIDRMFLKASAWCGMAALLSLTGLIHAYELTERGVQNKFGFWAAPAFALAYTLGALVLLALHAANRKPPMPQSTTLNGPETSSLHHRRNRGRRI
jgi:AGZA family xanthine/uracil permease-like MFS transporter